MGQSFGFQSKQRLEDEEKLTLEMQKELEEEFEGYVTGDIFSAAEKVIEERCPKWFLGWRDICRSTDERTVIACQFERFGVGNNLPIMLSINTPKPLIDCLTANLSSLAFDFMARFKIGGTHANFFIVEQLPVLSPDSYSEIIIKKISDLSGKITSKNFDSFNSRCELDALSFHLYHVDRSDVDYIMDTFPILKRKDIEKHGEFQTKKEILERYDFMEDLFYEN